MIRIIYILLSMLLLASCSDEQQYKDTDVDGDGDEVTLTFSVNVPSTSTAGTRAMSDMTDAKRLALDLWLVVFDKEGFYVQAAQATDQKNNGDETTFTVKLNRSTQTRKIHFVAVDVTNLTGAPSYFTKDYWDKKMKSLEYGHETDVIRSLTVPYPVDAYWQTTTVKTIHEDTKMTRIPLIRNFAQVQIATDSKLTDFELEGFAVCHAPEEGTVAPYNSSTGEFVEYTKTDDDDNLVSKKYDELTGYHGILPEEEYQNIPTGDGDGGLTFDKSAKYLYEIPNSEGDTKGKTYIIVKGKYNKGNSSYYKVDFVKRGDTGMEYYDILRNILYKGTIESVTADGYASAYLASQAAASNNISASTTTSGIPNISDGKQRIFVSSTLIVMTKNEAVTMKYKYVPNIAVGDTYGTKDVKYNKTLDFATQSDNGSDDSDGWRTLTITPNKPVPTSGIENGTIHFYVNTGNDDDEILTRDVQVVYRQPYSLAVTCPKEVVKTNGTAVTVTLQIANDFNEKMFPLTFYIEPSPKTLYPNASKNSLPVRIGKSLADGTTNSFSYEKTITWEEYQKLDNIAGTGYKALPCYFLTNTAESAATIYAYNEYCNTASCSFTNKEPIVDSYSGGQYYGVGQTVTLNINSTHASNNLTIKVSEEGYGDTTIDWVSGQTTYTYSTKTFGGNVKVVVTDNKTNESETIEPVRNKLLIRANAIYTEQENREMTISAGDGSVSATTSKYDYRSGTQSGYFSSDITITTTGLNATDDVTFKYTRKGGNNKGTYYATITAERAAEVTSNDVETLSWTKQ